MPRKYARKCLDFEGLVKDGEGYGVGGFCAQTANGTAHYKGTGYNKQWPDWKPDQVEPGGPWQPGPSNRTGE